MRKINKIFIHHSASEFGDAKLITEWHKERGWSDIGYHFVILNGYRTSEDYKKKNIDEKLIGTVERGLDVSKVGTHVKNHNSDSIGICLIHDKDPYNEKQLNAYRVLVSQLAMVYGVSIENIKGHYEVDSKKPLCPSLDMNKEREIIKEMME
jgi:N-acetyl-anhydromuramyl-L-alanine amidase AmpD